MGKSIKDAAKDNARIIDNITGKTTARGTQDIKDTQNTQDAPKKKGGRPATIENPTRINLKLPTALKEYLSVAAARASIEQKRTISVTAYICDLIRADMERNK